MTELEDVNNAQFFAALYRARAKLLQIRGSKQFSNSSYHGANITIVLDHPSAAPFLKNPADLDSATNKMTDKSSYDAKWEDMWIQEQTPWDKKQKVIILDHYTQQVYKHNSNIKRALVPGCGRGYDVITLCEIPSVDEVVGIDLAPTAISFAKELAQQEVTTHPEIKKAKFVLQDFFTLPSNEKFDLAFDYTFLCALHPTMREDWADKYKELIKPGGELFTLIFPLSTTNVFGRKDGDGPPHMINYDIVRDLLEKRGFVNIENRPCDMSFEQRKDNEWIARWVLKE
jgi:2-polyprenyl-3-methyl-5-hydroxy-6-metoxy-1,4-benzoquinol methylase